MNNERLAIKIQGIARVNICNDLPNEVWKELHIKDYFVSDKGRVKHKYGSFSHLLSTFVKGNGYVCVTIKHNGEKHNYYIHRLVAKSFIDNPNNLPEVNHKDRNKQNNNVDNLEWTSKINNVQHYFCDEIYQLDRKDNSIINKFINARQAAIAIGRPSLYSSIICCINHYPRYKSAGGYKWIKVSEYNENYLHKQILIL